MGSAYSPTRCRRTERPRRLPSVRNPKEQKKVDIEAGRKGSPVMLAENPIPILFMERAQPRASVCGRVRFRCSANFFFSRHRLLLSEELQRHLETSHFSGIVEPEQDQDTASGPGCDLTGDQRQQKVTEAYRDHSTDESDCADQQIVFLQEEGPSAVRVRSLPEVHPDWRRYRRAMRAEQT